LRAYQFAVYLALISAIATAVDTAMVHTNPTWFPGVNTTHESVVASGTRESMMRQNLHGINPDATVSDTATLGKTAFAGYLAYKMFVGIFDIYDILCNTIDVPYVSEQTLPDGTTTHTTHNMFSYFAAIIQMGVYCIYIIGFVQYWNKVMLKYAY
jgi:hypothetical protein